MTSGLLKIYLNCGTFNATDGVIQVNPLPSLIRKGIETGPCSSGQLDCPMLAHTRTASVLKNLADVPFRD
jgi:hypothetical protein